MKKKNDAKRRRMGGPVLRWLYSTQISYIKVGRFIVGSVVDAIAIVKQEIIMLLI